MPTSRELVLNKSLSGPELATIIESDLHRMLATNGFLSAYVAYGRVSYDIAITFHFDSPVLADQTEHLRSAPASAQQVEAVPGMAAIESTLPLLDPSPSALLSSDALHRDILSPNLARVEHGIPILVSSRDQDGHTQEREVLYPPDVTGAELAPPEIVDRSAEARKELGLPSEPLTVADLSNQSLESIPATVIPAALTQQGLTQTGESYTEAPPDGDPTI
jgi:hypothetical protein